MWCYSQWVMERMCGLWTPKVKLKTQPNRNLSLVLLRDSQIQHIPYSINTAQLFDQTCHPILRQLAEKVDHAEEQGVLSLRHYQASLHGSVKKKRALTWRQLCILCQFLEDCHDYTLHIRELLRTIRSKQRGRCSDHLLTVFKVDAYQRLALNAFSVEQSLFKSFIRSFSYEKDGARDATYIRYLHWPDQSARVEGCIGRVLFFFYDKTPLDNQRSSGSEKKVVSEYLLAFIETVQHQKDSKNGLIRKLPSNHGTSSQIIIDADDIEGLLGIVRNGNEEYMIMRDTCFLA